MKGRILMIEGQEWRWSRNRHWSPDRAGGRSLSTWEFVRVSDGRTMTGSRSRKHSIDVIASRIRDGVY